ncbi:magnesium-translocating P-type ATPase [Methylococcus capsulatus]|uniref:magnesium-translocating P-type ATPase n=1 Tax=Methylococcus capsulatus TaxID=414 RepID=UPI001C52B987|nr:magnesium-translocating P-type ATPase [Methylococcus capsulatus]QXP87441.1 magnesium-translocating P-type ATPase [Methylococcus capsulatus]UQN12447.1 magnesium-translocating P-type ATPase [Methylococcus capsulatus]
MNASDSEKNDLRRKIQDWAIRQGSVARDPQNWKALREAAVRYCRELGTIIPGGEIASSAPGVQADRTSQRLLEIATLGPDAALAELGSGMEGLTEQEAELRLREHGPNAIRQEKRPILVGELATRLRSPLNLLLLILATASFALDDRKTAVLIAVIVVLSNLLSLWQERRAKLEAEKLRALVKTTATVVRRATGTALPVSREIPLECLTPGDVIHLSAGDMVPADVRVLAAKDFFVNQAALTGESMPVEKFGSAQTAPAPLELKNLCFMATNVVSGSATAVVVQTGAGTYFGSIAGHLLGRRVLTSFDQGLNRFAMLMIRFMLVMVPLVFLLNGFTKGDWMEAFLFGVAVAVGLTPEILPMIVTINLAKGALAMSRKRVIVKQLSAIQNFGAMDILCTDKTGTLTQGRVVLERHLDLRGEESPRVLEFAFLSSHFQSGLKNLLDDAVLLHALDDGLPQTDGDWLKVDEIPFDFVRRRMSVVLEREPGRHRLVCKGAVEEMLAVCTHGDAEGERFDLDESHRRRLKESTAALNEEGFRVLAVAYKDIETPEISYDASAEKELALIGYVAFLDPPKDSAAAAIAELREHGVAIKILTGDNEIVTRKICHDVGLSMERVALGSAIEQLPDSELGHLLETTTVFAKLSPLQKARIIGLLQQKGHVVGFLGDGINDGPALKEADVGISVDGAVDVAKESADIILLEKNLEVLDDGVIEGRKVFGNIVKYLKMGASSNFGNMFSVVGASAFLPFLPMTPPQVLLNNLLYDLSQTTVATDDVDPEYLDRPRQWEIGHIARFMLCVGPVSSLFDYLTYFVLFSVFDAWTRPELFHTGWFVESLLSQTLIVHVIRTEKIPFLESRASLPLLATTVAICCVGIWLPYSSLAANLGFTALPGGYWPLLFLILAGYIALTQTIKVWLNRKYRID